MEHNKSFGPDGLPAEFYQVFWEVMKGDLMVLLRDFYEERLPLFSINFGIITLLSKMNDAKQIQRYRPIHVRNVDFKIFTKVATNRINSVASYVMQPSQIAFISRRNIMEGVIILHKTIHELHAKESFSKWGICMVTHVFS